LARRAYFRLYISANNIGASDDGIDDCGFESWGSYSNFIITRLHCRRLVVALAVGREIPGETGNLIGYLHRSVGDNGSIRIRNRTTNRSEIGSLRKDGRCSAEKAQGYEDTGKGLMGTVHNCSFVFQRIVDRCGEFSGEFHPL